MGGVESRKTVGSDEMAARYQTGIRRKLWSKGSEMTEDEGVST